MSLFVISLVVVASLTNMVADVFLVSGKDRDKVNQSPIEVARNTPDQHLNLSGMIGIISLALWMSVLYFLSYMKGDAGRFAMVFYAMYIGAIMVFHVICSYIFLLVKHSKLIRISHFESIAGTLSMLIAMLSTIHLMMTNFPI